jgi:poly(3-hydroxybutyrate) depolymerase
MPRIKRGEKFIPEPISLSKQYGDKTTDPANPYIQLGSGLIKKEVKIGDSVRKYAVYNPGNLTSKASATIIFPNSGVTAEEFIGSENWSRLSEKYQLALLILESDCWNKDDVQADFDFVQMVVYKEFLQRLTVDICESYIYPLGFGDGAYTATAFSLTYSATFPAFAADGDCGIDGELLEVLRTLPSDGLLTLKKTDIALPGFIIDRRGNADAVFEYLKETIKAKEENLSNAFARVYLESPRPGAYFVNEQPVSQVWLADSNSTGSFTREQLNEEMVKFVLRFARWGGSRNNHLRAKKSQQELGVQRVERIIEGEKRFWDVFVPSCYRPEDGKQYPLVVAIHGYSCNASYFEQTSDWHRIAEERGFLVCFASAYPRNTLLSSALLPCWNCGDQPGADKDISYFNELLDYMTESYNIDKGRVYAAGHSNGSQMTQALSRVLPERFAAFAPSGALMAMNVDSIVPLSGKLECPIWFVIGEYDLFPTEIADGSLATKTLEEYCRLNKTLFSTEHQYENGIYNNIVMYNDQHTPMVRYTKMMGCPHTYTSEMAQMTWDDFFCHFIRADDGTIIYRG